MSRLWTLEEVAAKAAATQAGDMSPGDLSSLQSDLEAQVRLNRTSQHQKAPGHLELHRAMESLRKDISRSLNIKRREEADKKLADGIAAKTQEDLDRKAREADARVKAAEETAQKKAAEKAAKEAKEKAEEEAKAKADAESLLAAAATASAASAAASMPATSGGAASSASGAKAPEPASPAGPSPAAKVSAKVAWADIALDDEEIKYLEHVEKEWQKHLEASQKVTETLEFPSNLEEALGDMGPLFKKVLTGLGVDHNYAGDAIPANAGFIFDKKMTTADLKTEMTRLGPNKADAAAFVSGFMFGLLTGTVDEDDLEKSSIRSFGRRCCFAVMAKEILSKKKDSEKVSGLRADMVDLQRIKARFGLVYGNGTAATKFSTICVEKIPKLVAARADASDRLDSYYRMGTTSRMATVYAVVDYEAGAKIVSNDKLAGRTPCDPPKGKQKAGQGKSWVQVRTLKDPAPNVARFRSVCTDTERKAIEAYADATSLGWSNDEVNFIKDKCDTSALTGVDDFVATKERINNSLKPLRSRAKGLTDALRQRRLAADMLAGGGVMNSDNVIVSLDELDGPPKKGKGKGSSEERRAFSDAEKRSGEARLLGYIRDGRYTDSLEELIRQLPDGIPDGGRRAFIKAFLAGNLGSLLK